MKHPKVLMTFVILILESIGLCRDRIWNRIGKNLINFLLFLWGHGQKFSGSAGRDIHILLQGAATSTTLPSARRSFI